jgi:hypothetical protein
LLEGVELVDDGTLPDFESCTRSGPLPEVVRGRFERQLDHVLKRVRAVPPSESVALLHPRGGGWFRRTRERLAAAGMVWVDIQQRPEWPQGPQNIALSTLHSAKGLEFDHVIILGLSAEMLPHGREENDAELDNHRRLVAMAVGRARESLILTFKPGEASAVVDFLRPGTFREVTL